jgi:hypothetical protein
MSCTVHAVTVTATGEAYGGRARLKGVYYVNPASAGSIVIRDGGASGTVRLDIATPAVAGQSDLMIPDDGILHSDDMHVTLTNITSCTLIYE